MTGYLSRLAARSTNATTGLRPRAPSMFEAAAPVGLEPFGLGAADAPDIPAAPSRPRPPEVGTSPRQMEPPDRAVQPALADGPAAPSTSRRRPSPVDEWAAPADHTGAERAAAGGRPATQFGAASPAAPSWEPSSTPDNPHDLSAQKAPPVPPPDPAAKSLLAPAQHPRHDVGLPAPVQPRGADVALPRLHPVPPPPEPAPEVTVSIGRIEVVTQPPAPSAPPVRAARPTRPSTAPTLTDYLRDRSRR